ncbi:MAG: hypothetical protein HPY53_10610 [Brevinematales bacterium]|nr:hypothetical protein [Brevinematales bacterium]
MAQREEVIKVMEHNGGFATLGYINQKVDVSNWKTKTPFASIRRIVQNARYFFKIKPGLWALNSYKDKLPVELLSNKKIPITQQNEFNHSYYQGLILEIGNMNNYETFIPYQDKNKKFLNKKLGDISTIKEFYYFTYERIIRKAITVDVSWFNERKMPYSLFEIEHSTDIQNSLLKFLELQDFNTKFYIVADLTREREFNSKIDLSAFKPIKKRVKFIDYEELTEFHSKTYEYKKLENKIRL